MRIYFASEETVAIITLIAGHKSTDVTKNLKSKAQFLALFNTFLFFTISSLDNNRYLQRDKFQFDNIFCVDLIKDSEETN